MKNFGILFCAAVLYATPLICQPHQLQTFSLQSVRLLESPFKQAQQTDLEYILALEPDRLLAPFQQEAGIKPKAPAYGNWEGTGLDGHTGGHYLSALALMYASTGDQRLSQRLNYMLGKLQECQQKNGNGYVGGIPGGNAMWKEIAAQKIDAGSFSLNGRWVPLYNIHKLFAGLVDSYTIAQSAKAKTILIDLAEWFVNVTGHLSDEQLQTILQSEHGGMNEALADVAAITGNNKYLDLARRMSHRVVLNPLLQQQDQLTGMHANTQIPKVIGYKRIAELGGDTAWASAANFFWNTVTQNRSIAIGGNSVREHFNPLQDFTPMLESKEGPESCNSYNMLKLTRQLFLTRPAAGYMDYYERTLYNHILSTQHPNGGFVYFTPIRPRHYRVYSQPSQSFWCCVGTGIENHGKYGELIYAHNNRDLYVNLFIPSQLTWKEKGIELKQQTGFPYEESSRLQLTVSSPQKFTLYIRQPSWLVAKQFNILVNGKKVAVQPDGNGYVAVSRTWRTGDVVRVALPMQTKVEQLPDGSPWVSFIKGPIVLAAPTDTTDLVGLRAGDGRMEHIADGPLYPIEEAPMIVTANSNFADQLQPVPGKPLTYTVSNLVYPARYKNLQLVPFYTIHDARYMMYWRWAKPQQLDSIKENIREKEAEQLALEAITVDQVAPGEQQPESDHNFKGEKTESGIFNNRHWRHATGWFSYDLKNTGQQANKLRITYNSGDHGRKFDILVNNVLLTTVTTDGAKGNPFFDKDYDLPASVKDQKIITVTFKAYPGSVAGGIYGVRLIK